MNDLGPGAGFIVSNLARSGAHPAEYDVSLENGDGKEGTGSHVGAGSLCYRLLLCPADPRIRPHAARIRVVFSAINGDFSFALMMMRESVGSAWSMKRS